MASRIADKAGITRSVIVNALRKFESAGVIESRSSGMKGTNIKVINDAVFDELRQIEEKKGIPENIKILESFISPLTFSDKHTNIMTKG